MMLIILIGFFILVVNKNEILELDTETSQTEKKPGELKDITKIPKTAFWVENNGKGNWFNIDRMQGLQNNAIISIYDTFGILVIRSRFFKICPLDELKLIEDLKTEIDYYDGKNIQLKDNCYLLKN